MKYGPKHILAQILSYALHPGIMPTLGALYVLYALPQTFTWESIIRITGVVFVGTYIGPLIAIYVLQLSGIISSVHLIRKQDRIYPYIAGAAMTLATGNYLGNHYVPFEITFSVYASAFVILLSTILIPFFKSSAHMAGLSGFLALYLAMNFRYAVGSVDQFLFIAALLGAMAWSRSYLNRHTPLELLSGTILGFGIIYILLVR